ncbi:trypsin-like peptidase domain-containing protein [Bacillus sp. 165]|uniref:S1C family serine protease n=1 Tax=Bacillus sp. 165 TaxID=1529117 RepID=UPI001ADA4D20|nr:trypsin-like peptidase domain-containing protein [Bacillus sp. 165]MBO9129061.1 trypsin-like peptidase domain-containing protein [Bacillus sp. 165]
MGYYDETETNQRYKEPKKRGKKGYFFTGFVGAVIGAVTVTAATPYLYNNENAQAPISQNTKVEGTSMPVSQSIKGTTDLAEMIQGAKEVVVGVMNYQASDPFSANVQEAGSGSGVIYKKAGNKAYIITNNHVVQDAKKLQVKLSNGTVVEANLIGTDPLMDLAVVAIDGTGINKIATLGNSDNMRVGDQAIAIGNPLGLEGTVTEGIISSKDREIPVDLDQNGQPDWEAQVLQTDASINPGNSGGALLNANGEVIGINSSKIAEETVEGIGFAIPINVAKPIIESIEKYGEVKRPFVGVELKSLEDVPSYALQNTLKLPNDVKTGVVILGVTPTSPAAKAGLQEMDVVVELDGQKIENSLQFRKYLYEKKKIGDDISVTYYRSGKKMEKSLKLSTAN